MSEMPKISTNQHAIRNCLSELSEKLDILEEITISSSKTNMTVQLSKGWDANYIELGFLPSSYKNNVFDYTVLKQRHLDLNY